MLNFAQHDKRFTYHFGSQSEGSTTQGMDSDIDCLVRLTNMLVIQNIADRQFEKINYFVVKDMSTPPQCCCLHKLMPNDSLTSPKDYLFVDAQGRVFLKNNCMKLFLKPMSELYDVDVIQHGPAQSVSSAPDLEYVYALYCDKLPEVCQYIFRRQKPGHWPTPALLEQLKDSGVFIVSTSHVENTTHWDPRQHIGTLTVRTFDNSHELYWRLSTNMMERLLMFNLTMTQMKVYVIMKIIRTELCKPLVGDRLSTYHLKTTLMYSVEMSPPHIWKDENLIQCIQVCLTTLRRWLKVRYCPHYTTENVNLFDGKLRLNEFPVLIELFTDMICTDVSCLYNVKMDDLGNRISSHSPYSTNGRRFEKMDPVIATKMFNFLVTKLFDSFYFFDSSDWRRDTSYVINNRATYIRNLETMYTDCPEPFRPAISISLPFQYSIQAVTKASLCIGENQTLTHEIFTLCDKSLMSDLTSSRLRLASIYFSARRFEEAAAILKQLDTLISDKVILVSPVYYYSKNKFLYELLARQKGFLHILQNEVAVCTIFSRHEINCVPGQLVAEFYRTVTVEGKGCRLPSPHWMDFAMVDSLPYMYYLQYLIYRTAGLNSDKRRAFKNLVDIFKTHDALKEYHIDTSLNLIGHVWELEGYLSVAWRAYKFSVERRPQNNAAYWHMFRMIGGLIYGLRMLSW
ncbi:hypothetical protein DPMN_162014 [Dreissena polymorpha]|uniref:Mab-21-like HhH/H2TH-like domain-containing protein n=2 Tax=Dreissena polymorpha TaxID=45954 RepID=A0A9D4ERI3_DREPO|nr:hypothetical protein DPMN_162014 [Dreissena polymorpha]